MKHDHINDEQLSNVHGGKGDGTGTGGGGGNELRACLRHAVDHLVSVAF